MPSSKTLEYPKHKTPNIRQVRHSQTYTDVFGSPRTRVWWVWEKAPLRATRKDLP